MVILVLVVLLCFGKSLQFNNNHCYHHYAHTRRKTGPYVHGLFLALSFHLWFFVAYFPFPFQFPSDKNQSLQDRRSRGRWLCFSPPILLLLLLL